jgi:hypothetical protein
MHRSDLYERIGFEEEAGSKRIENVEILVPVEFTDPERRKFQELMEEGTEGCRVIHEVKDSNLGRLKQALTSWRKYDLVFISNHRMHLLYPLLGKGLIKMEDDRLHRYHLSYVRAIRLIFSAVFLGVKITFRRFFAFGRWRKKLIWRPPGILSERPPNDG